MVGLERSGKLGHRQHHVRPAEAVERAVLVQRVGAVVEQREQHLGVRHLALRIIAVILVEDRLPCLRHEVQIGGNAKSRRFALLAGDVNQQMARQVGGNRLLAGDGDQVRAKRDQHTLDGSLVHAADDGQQAQDVGERLNAVFLRGKVGHIGCLDEQLPI